jgi:hypothetical protein
MCIVRRRARWTGRFAYRVLLPRSVQSDNIETHLDKDVLAVRDAKAA